MKCPKCNSEGCWREEVDIGVGIQYGPYGCPDCGWSEWEEYDISEHTKEEDGYALDQWGGKTRIRSSQHEKG